MESADHATRPALTGAEALRLATTIAPEAVLLDLGLPDRDGKEVLADLRAFSNVPVLVFSARDREAEKVAALDLGADDYLEKPFGIGELLARLRKAARHAAREAEGRQEATLFEIGGLSVDLDGETLRLTPKEYEILAVLLRHQARVMTHRQILAAVWGPAHHDDTHYLRLHRPVAPQDRARSRPYDADPHRTGRGYRFTESG